MTARLGILAYGPDAQLHTQCQAALLSAIAFAPEGVEMIVLTDRPDGYLWLGTDVGVVRFDGVRFVL